MTFETYFLLRSPDLLFFPGPRHVCSEISDAGTRNSGIMIPAYLDLCTEITPVRLHASVKDQFTDLYHQYSRTMSTKRDFIARD